MQLDPTADAIALADLVRKGEVKPSELVEAAIAGSVRCGRLGAVPAPGRLKAEAISAGVRARS